jgi:hypothetical protein
MTRLRKITPWLNLVIGLLWILMGLRNIYMPDFLSLTNLSNADKASLAPIELVVGVLWLAGGLVGLFKGRHITEGKLDVGVTTILGRDKPMQDT